MSDRYRTLAREAVGEITEKRSRFICSLSPVSSVEQAQVFVARVRAGNRDARHNVFAYILREGDFCRCSDDGEPQGTGGAPVLDILRGAGLSDVCAVVTRYFGGVLLGTGGLARAYSDAAREALLHAETVVNALFTRLSVTCDYGFYGALPALAASFGGEVRDTVFAAEVTACADVPAECAAAFAAAVTERSAGRVKAVPAGELYRAIS